MGPKTPKNSPQQNGSQKIEEHTSERVLAEQQKIEEHISERVPAEQETTW